MNIVSVHWEITDELADILLKDWSEPVRIKIVDAPDGPRLWVKDAG